MLAAVKRGGARSSRPAMLAAAVAVAAAACTGGRGGETPAGPVDLSAARTSVVQLFELAAAIDVADGPRAGEAILSWGRATVSVVTRAVQEGRFLFPGTFAPHHPDEGALECHPGVCGFHDYGITELGARRVLAGTVNHIGSNYSLDLVLELSDRFDEMRWRMTGVVFLAPNGVFGQLRLAGSGELGGAVEWDLTIDYDSVGLDPQGCPVVGSLHETVSVETPEESIDTSGRAMFGPGCADAR